MPNNYYVAICVAQEQRIQHSTIFIRLRLNTLQRAVANSAVVAKATMAKSAAAMVRRRLAAGSFIAW